MFACYRQDVAARPDCSRGTRIGWIDIAKGIAIILMVVGHSSLPGVVGHWIFAFHMPLFFILSGMTTKWTGCSIWAFIRHKTIALGRPFIIYSAVCAAVIYLFSLGSLSWARGWGDFALWFVPVLYVAIIIARLILSGNRTLMLAFCVILPVISGILDYYKIQLPWNMSVAPYAAFFVLLGYYAKSFICMGSRARLIPCIVSFCITVIISHFWHLDMVRNECLPLIPLSIGAVSGTYFIISVSKFIETKTRYISKTLQLIGRETFIILSFSQVFIMALNKFFVLNGLVKYALLVVAMIAVKLIKDMVVRIYGSICR